jgi:hypothetical protein
MDKRALGCATNSKCFNQSPPQSTLAQDKVVEQRHVSLFLVQLTIEGAPTTLSLETPYNFMATN